jgi:hypothetical protein
LSAAAELVAYLQAVMQEARWTPTPSIRGGATSQRAVV